MRAKHTHPKRIGPYRILELVGEGAWGWVYLAEQQEPIRRKVAVKVLKRGLDTDEVLARFEAERQAMAMMSHPNIALVLDAGATEHGLSYFAMEYVSDEPITDYCDHHALTLRQRIELFQQVCQAVQHAHQNGVIHRDLKPNNVLVAFQEGRAVAKVIDFGIAKAIHHPLTDKSFYTAEGRFIGTPGYISPEQARIGGLDVDTTTDVYALGVMLYELLTGALPLDVRQLDTESMLRTLREKDPPTPSERLTAMGAKAETVARTRRVDAKTLKRLVEGELTWVMARAMEKDRSRRYQAASELAAELGRYLRGEPLLVGPPGAMYQLKKLVARHKGAVATVVMLVVLLSGFSVAMAVQVRRVAAEAERANRGEAAAETVSQFLVGLFEVSDSSEWVALEAESADREESGRTITARELLDRGVERIDDELIDQPLVRARLMHTIGSVLTSLGLYEEAVPLLEKSVALRESQLGGDHLDVGESLYPLAQVYKKQSRLSEARVLYERAIAILEGKLGATHPDVARPLKALADLHRRNGDYADGQALAERALAIEEAELGSDHLKVGDSLIVLGILHMFQGDYSRAEALFLRALEIYEKALGPDHFNVNYALGNLGLIYTRMGQYDDAECLLRRSLAINERALGPDHPDVADSLVNLANVLRIDNRPGEAERSYLRALKIKEKALGPDHPNTAGILNNLALVYRRQKRDVQAEALYLRTLDIQEKALGPDHLHVGITLNNLGELYLEQSHFVQAETLLGRSLAIYKKTLGPDHPSLAIPLHNLGLLNRDTGAYAAAEKLFQRALAIREKALGPNHPDVAETLSGYAGLLRKVGRTEEAESMERRSDSILAGQTEEAES